MSVRRALHGGIGALKKGKKRIDKEAKQRQKQREQAEKEGRKRDRLLKKAFVQHTPTWAAEAGTLLR